MHKTIERIIKILSVSAALLTALASVFEVIYSTFEDKEEEEWGKIKKASGIISGWPS